VPLTQPFDYRVKDSLHSFDISVVVRQQKFQSINITAFILVPQKRRRFTAEPLEISGPPDADGELDVLLTTGQSYAPCQKSQVNMHWGNREILKAFTKKRKVEETAVEGHDDPRFGQCASEGGFVTSSYVGTILRAGAPADEGYLIVVNAEPGRLDIQKNGLRGETERDPIVFLARETVGEEPNSTVPQGTSRRFQC
jgi:hypothetical protein